MIRMESREQDTLQSAFNAPLLLASDIETAADVLLTMVESVSDILMVSSAKLELLGSYADSYRSEVGRVSHVLYAMNVLLDRVKEKNHKISLALIEESRKERTV